MAVNYRLNLQMVFTDEAERDAAALQLKNLAAQQKPPSTVQAVISKDSIFAQNRTDENI